MSPCASTVMRSRPLSTMNSSSFSSAWTPSVMDGALLPPMATVEAHGRAMGAESKTISSSPLPASSSWAW